MESSGVELVLREIRLARQESGRVCPRCESARIHRWGSFSGRQRFRCLACRRTFSDLTGTPLAYTKRLDRWIAFAGCMVRKRSVRACARQLGIDKDTALRWRHLLLEAMRHLEDIRLDGVIEMEAVRFHHSEKGRRRLSRRPFRRGSRTGILRRDQMWVLLLLDMEGRVSADPLGPRRAVQGVDLAKLLVRRCVGSPTIVAFRSWTIPLTWYCRQTGARHAVAHGTGRGSCLEPHIGRLLAYDRRFRCWLESFRGVASRYLANYLCWHRFMDAAVGGALELLGRAVRRPQFLRTEPERRGTEQVDPRSRRGASHRARGGPGPGAPCLARSPLPAR